jgi:RNA polymerase sigma factor (sigma-70 family)
MTSPSEIARSLEPHRRALFGVCYRMTGSAADAEDLVQDTFRRAIERPPPDLEAPLRPWLVRVATNLCIDTLRKRRNDAYFGPWLPSPVETALLETDIEPGPEARYGALESATLAFLIALEALTPKQRAVLVLRDVLGMTGPEVADTLAMSEANVRVSLHRAREALQSYDAERCQPRTKLTEQTKRAMHAFLMALVIGDAERLTELLASDVCSISDAAGETAALVTPVVGRERVITTFMSLRKVQSAPAFLEERSYNGLPALVVRTSGRGQGPPRYVVQVAINGEGRITRIWAVSATRKLHSVAFDDTDISVK